MFAKVLLTNLLRTNQYLYFCYQLRLAVSTHFLCGSIVRINTAYISRYGNQFDSSICCNHVCPPFAPVCPVG